MTEDFYRKKLVDTAVSFLGKNEYDGTHKEIIDIYNSIVPLPRNYKVTYNDPWCAATVSAVAKKAELLSIIPAECSCFYMIDGFKKLGRWEERDDYKPKAGDIIFYDWEDDGNGDNMGTPDHVGIVEKCGDNAISVIEGNYSNSVKRRTLVVNGRYIRGYGIPDYKALASETIPWYEKDGSWADATRLGLVNGQLPEAKATRAEVAAVAVRLLDIIMKWNNIEADRRYD